MGRNPKQDANLAPPFDSNQSREEAAKNGRKGGKRSGEVRRAKRDARSAARYILELAAEGGLKDNLKKLGVPEDERTNMAALQARLFTMAMSGNLEAYLTMMRMAGYDPEENRKERESVASDRRRDIEVDAKVAALGSNAENASLALNMGGEDSDNDVVIYIPKMLSEEECKANDGGEGDNAEPRTEEQDTTE